MSLKIFIKTLFVTFPFFISSISHADVVQKKVEKERVHITADVFEGYASDNKDESFNQFIGNVKAVNENFTYQADVVTFFDKKDLMESEGHIRIDGNKKKFTATAGKVTYKTKEKIAYLMNKVQGYQDNISFFSEDVEYHSRKKQLIFKHSGTIKDEDMTVSSVQGIMNTKTKFITLTKDVIVNMKEHELNCQKLTYNKRNELIKFNGDVKLIVKEDKSYMTTPREGIYRKRAKKIFLEQGLFHSKTALGYAKKIVIDQQKNIIQADEDIEIINKDKDLFTAQHLTYNNQDKKGAFFGNPLVQKNNGDEKFYLIADRFEISQESLPTPKHDYDVFDDKKEDEQEEEKDNEKRKPFLLKALDNVNIYSKDFQGKSKNLSFDGKSSRIVFDGNPVFWTKNSQLTGQDVEMKIKKNEVERLDFFKQAFMIIKDDVGFYNQSKGKSMHIRFFENKLDDLLIKDNVESLLFVTNDGKFVGTNNIKCPKMTIATNEDFKPEKIIFLDQSSAVFFPKDQVDVSSLILLGFRWRIKEKPSLSMFKKRLPKKSNIPEDEKFVEDDSEIIKDDEEDSKE
ncbi:MAG: hypothetical protein LBD32_01475 [Cytophagales bacterium]|jgi:lipopolysaccharide export system protein LptA|nr:hypothetical protein [Cytophagales bacterium]